MSPGEPLAAISTSKQSIIIIMDGLTYLKGGAEVMVLNLCRYAVCQGWQVNLYGPRPADDKLLEAVAARDGFTLTLLPAVQAFLLGQPDLRWALPSSLGRRLPTERTTFMVNDLGPLAFSILHHRPRQAEHVIFFMHTYWPAAVRSMRGFSASRLMQSMMNNLARWVARRCDVLVAPSHAVANALVGLGISPDKLRVIPTGLDPFFFELPNDRRVQAWRTEFGAPIVLYSGRLSHEKNIPLLLRAFGLVLKQHPQAQLVIAGDGSLCGNFTALARQLGIGAHTHLIGKLERSELVALYWAADVFCMPSVAESQGLALLEAQACARPCVAMNRMGSSDAIQHGVDGLLVEVDDKLEVTTRLLANALGQLLDEPEYASRLGQTARLKVMQRSNDLSNAELLRLVASISAPAGT